jgi:hypothetical protein
MGVPPPSPRLLFSNDKKVAKKSLKIGGCAQGYGPTQYHPIFSYRTFV